MIEEVINKEEATAATTTENGEKTTYSYTHAFEASKDYFNGEELPARVFVDKYAMKDLEGKIYENTPEQMHWRLAK
jgi:ribonucleoside-diphosphate reductase alpha chain